MPINYYLRNAGGGNAVITITDPSQKAIATLNGPTDAGFNTVVWDMQSREASGAGRGLRGGARGMRGMRGTPVEPGEYLVTLETAGKKLTRKAQVKKAANWPVKFTVIRDEN